MGIKRKNSLLHSTAAAILSLCLLCTSVPQLSALGGSDGDPEYFYASPGEAMSGLVGAENNGSITVIHDVDSRLYESTTDLIEDNQTVGWTGSGIGVSKTDASSVYPYRSLYGGMCLSLDYPRSAESFIYREYQKYEMSDEYVISPGPASGSPEGIDFHSVHTVSFALNLCSEESETFFIEIYVSDYLVYTERFTVSGSGWNAVYADISAAHSSIYGPASIGRISVGIEKGGDTGRGQVLLDGLAFSTSDAAQRYQIGRAHV